MQKQIKRSYTTITIVLLALVPYIFSSCDNFLNAKNIKNEIEESIEIANSSVITYNITNEKGSGSVTPQQIKVKKKEVFELVYEPEENWQFICWEVLDKTSGKVVEDAVYFYSKDKTETKAYIINPGENLLIHAKSIKIPCITKIEPSTPGYANIPITINFNISMEAENITSEVSQFNFNNILLTCNGEDVSEYFEAPVFNKDKTELTIVPKSSAENGVHLKNYIENILNAGSAEIKVTFTDAIKVVQNEKTMGIKNPQQFVYYVPVVDTKAPSSHAFFVTRDSSLTFENAEDKTIFTQNKKFHKQDIPPINAAEIDEEYENRVLQNACDGTIYIYGRFYDDGSGVKSVIVSELMTNICEDAISVNDAELIITEYTKDTADADFYTSNNETVFIIKHTIKTYSKTSSGNYGGAVSLDITVNDFCYNATEIEHFTVITCTRICPGGNPIQPVFAQDLQSVSEWTDYEAYIALIKSHIQSVFTYFSYENYVIYNWVSYKENNCNVELRFLDKNNNITKVIEPTFVEGPFDDNGDTYDYKLTFDVGDFEIIPGSSIIIVFENFLGVVEENIVWSFPLDDYVIYPDISADNSSVDFYYKNGVKVYGLLLRKNTQNKWECKYTDQIEAGYSYSFMVSGIIMKNCSFCVDETLEIPEDIEIKKISISKSGKDGYFDVTVELKKDSIKGFNNIYYYSQPVNEIGIIPPDSSSFSISIWQPYIVAASDGELIACHIYGFKNNRRTYGTPCIIPVFSKTESSQETKNAYDFAAPIFKHSMQGHNVEISMEDNWSGIKSGVIETENEKFTFSSDKPSCVIPVWKLLTCTNDLSEIHMYGEDKAGNKIDEHMLASSFFTPITAKVLKDDSEPDKLFIKTNPVSNFYCYTFDDEDGFPTEFGKTGDKDITARTTSVYTVPETGDNVTIHYVNPYISLDDLSSYAEGQYLKFVYHYRPEGNSYLMTSLFFNQYGTPIYYYYGTPGTGEHDFMIPNGSSKESVVISSDKPVYVHTIVTSRPLKECKNWDYREWEYYKEEFGEKIIDFDANTTPKVYNIPVDQIETNKNYVVIAHYSDNHVVMSEVMTK